MRFLMIIFILLSSCSHQTLKKKSWSDFKEPTKGKNASLGSSSLGCLSGAIRFSFDSPHSIVMRPSRGRFFGHEELVSFLQDVSESFYKKTNRKLIIGDMAQSRGGFLPGSHMSHQNGLDVDLWLDSFEKIPSDFSVEDFPATNFVKNKTLWGKNQETLVRIVAQDPRLDRLLISPYLKKELCEKFKNAPWLNRVRPWWGHDDHIHVRLKCFSEDHLCKNAPPPPKNPECGKELDWWFKEEAKTPPPAKETQKEREEKIFAPCEPIRDEV